MHHNSVWRVANLFNVCNMFVSFNTVQNFDLKILNFFPSSSQCLQSISLRTTSSPLGLANTAEANAPFLITLIFSISDKAKLSIVFASSKRFLGGINKCYFERHFTSEFVFNQPCFIFLPLKI